MLTTRRHGFRTRWRSGPGRLRAPGNPPVVLPPLHEGLSAGAAAGIPGTFPLAWGDRSGSATYQVLSGPMIVDGVEVFDVRLTGSGSLRSLDFHSPSWGGQVANPGEDWLWEVYMAVLDGAQWDAYAGVTLFQQDADWDYVTDTGFEGLHLIPGAPLARVRQIVSVVPGAARINGQVYFEASVPTTFRLSGGLLTRLV